ncbi:ketosynthase chain-length factor [Nonomuraea typhae]|uniref:Ketosynthase chain-length factor n=1 Tax=Nonomuraea typhae TaxID=2603600 RepID=A0ABW7YPQ6_9ACTN
MRADAAAGAGPGTIAPVVTGLGVAAPNGLGTEAFWEATVQGRSGIARITRFDPAQYPARLAGEVKDFRPAEHLPSRLVPQTDHMTRLALVAAEEALADSGADLSALDELELGVVTAAGSGGFEFAHRELEKLWSKGPEHVSAYQSFAWFYAVNSGQISIRHNLRGPSGVLVTDQAGGLDALAQARRQFRKGAALVVTGGVDGSLCPWGWVAQLTTGHVSTAEDPDAAFLPFSGQARGFVPGEGGAILVLEREPRPGRRPYGRIAGYAATFDPKPGIGRPPGLSRAIELALTDAGVRPGEVDVVFADAAGVPDLDCSEAAALRAVFGPRGVPVTAPKTMTGRLYSGGSALDLATALLSIKHDLVPPTVNVAEPLEEYALDLVTEARSTRVDTALVLARGHGGFNAAVVLRAPG